MNTETSYVHMHSDMSMLKASNPRGVVSIDYNFDKNSETKDGCVRYQHASFSAKL